MTRMYRTFGKALADPNSNIHRKLEAGRKQTQPIKDEVARLMAEQGLSGPDAWAEVLKRVAP